MSKHLKVLRSAGFVSSRTAAQHRVYRLETGPFLDLDEWLAPYREFFEARIPGLERQLASKRRQEEQ